MVAERGPKLDAKTHFGAGSWVAPGVYGEHVLTKHCVWGARMRKGKEHEKVHKLGVVWIAPRERERESTREP